MKIEVFASQTHVTEKDIRGKDCVVIDTLRATSTIITALAKDLAAGRGITIIKGQD